MKTFTIVPVASHVLSPPSLETCHLFEQMYQAELYDPRFTEEHEGMLGQYMLMFNEGRSEVTHVWLAYSVAEPSQIFGTAMIVQGKEKYLHLFVKPWFRNCGVGSALMEAVLAEHRDFKVNYTEDTVFFFPRYGVPNPREPEELFNYHGVRSALALPLPQDA